MIRGLYTAASGMLAGQRRQEILTNNLINAHTVGYKQDDAVLRSFPEELILRVREQQGAEVAGSPIRARSGMTPIGSLYGAVYTHEVVPQFNKGVLQRTDNPFDVAIEEELVNTTNGEQATLFFTVRDTQGNTYYTRDGRWTTDPMGQLTTFNGSLVLDIDGNPIQVDGRNMEVMPDGRVILTDPANPDNRAVIQLGLAMSRNPAQELVKGENGYFRMEGGGTLPVVDPLDPNMANWRYALSQGAIETSNVDVTRTMTHMVEGFRYYEANQKVLQATDRTLEKAVTEIGRV